MTQRITICLTAAACLALSGCNKHSGDNAASAPSEASGPTADEASAMILDYERRNCAWENFAYVGQYYSPLSDFFQQQVQAGFLTQMQGGPASGAGVQNYTYTDQHGVQQIVQFWWNPPWRVGVKDCFFVPAAVQVLDTTVNGKEAQIVFRNSSSEPSQLEQKLVAAISYQPDQTMFVGPAKDQNNVKVDGVELVANLELLDATGWRINTILPH